MTRDHLKQLTRTRVREAKQLLDAGNYSGAYYLVGYAIECSLKACISRQIHQNEIPEKKLINDIYTHNVKELVKLAGLEANRATQESANANFAANWGVVKNWNETSRYKTFTEVQARELYDSITSRNGGILQWIKQYW